MRDEFEPTGLGKTTFEKSYANGRSWRGYTEDTATRVGLGVREDTDSFTEVIALGLLAPAGRIDYGGSNLLNCFVLPTGDSREEWGRTVSDSIVTTGVGGGYGVNFGSIRGRDYPVGTLGGVSTGSVSLQRILNGVGNEMMMGNARRMAAMFALPIDHPDLMEFINIKADLEKGELKNANLSVVFHDGLTPLQWQEMVQGGHNFYPKFEGKQDVLKRTYNARAVWGTIVRNALAGGEPGTLNQHLAMQMHPHLYELTSTNPCGEIWLPNYGNCCLAHLVLPRFVEDGRLNWELLRETIHTGVRFLDNVLDATEYPLDEMRQVSQMERRVGLGVLGLHSMLLDLGHQYNTPEAAQLVNRLFEFIANHAYQASAQLAMERGTYPLYPERIRNGFERKLWRETRNLVEQHGLRNVAVLTVAPTGTKSMVFGYTGGIEPLIAPAYIRRTLEADGSYAETFVVHRDYLDHPELVQGAYDIRVKDHIAMQIAVQAWVDNSVSKTINVPKSMSEAEISNQWLNALPYVKGMTVYKEGSRENEPMQAFRIGEIKQRLAEWEGDVDYEGIDVDDCVGGLCTI
jgi:ribonucleoside-diphosphate reductase alpha chain